MIVRSISLDFFRLSGFRTAGRHGASRNKRRKKHFFHVVFYRV